jgi:hypothetical protein
MFGDQVKPFLPSLSIFGNTSLRMPGQLTGNNLAGLNKCEHASRFPAGDNMNRYYVTIG